MPCCQNHFQQSCANFIAPKLIHYIHSQFCWQVTGRIVLVLDDVVALVDGLEQRERVSDTEDGSETSREQLTGGRPGVFTDLSSQLRYQFCLTLLDVRLLRKSIFTAKHFPPIATHTHAHTDLPSEKCNKRKLQRGISMSNNMQVFQKYFAPLVGCTLRIGQSRIFIDPTAYNDCGKDKQLEVIFRHERAIFWRPEKNV